MNKLLNIKTNHHYLIIAHRGESYDAPENTMAAIQLAWEHDADAVEIDVHLSKDKKIVVIHDDNTKRTGKRNKKVKDQTVQELKKIDVGSFKNYKWENERIPLLEEVLSIVPPGKKIIIEIKCGKEIISILKNEIERSGLKNDQVVFISFNYQLISELKSKLPEYKALWILNLDYSWFSKILMPSWKKIIHKTIKNKLDGIDVWAGNKVNKDSIQKIKTFNLLIYMWTVNNFHKAKELVEWGVDAITTDKAGWLKSKIS